MTKRKIEREKGKRSEWKEELLQCCHSHCCILRMPGQSELEEVEQRKEGWGKLLQLYLSHSVKVGQQTHHQTAQFYLCVSKDQGTWWGGVLKKSGFSPGAHEDELRGRRQTWCVWHGLPNSSEMCIHSKSNQACQHTQHENIWFFSFCHTVLYTGTKKSIVSGIH